MEKNVKFKKKLLMIEVESLKEKMPCGCGGSRSSYSTTVPRQTTQRQTVQRTTSSPVTFSSSKTLENVKKDLEELKKKHFR